MELCIKSLRVGWGGLGGGVARVGDSWKLYAHIRAHRFLTIYRVKPYPFTENIRIHWLILLHLLLPHLRWRRRRGRCCRRRHIHPFHFHLQHRISPHRGTRISRNVRAFRSANRMIRFFAKVLFYCRTYYTFWIGFSILSPSHTSIRRLGTYFRLQNVQ